MFRVPISLVILIANAHSIQHPWQSEFDGTTSVCTTDVCIEHGKYLAGNIDSRVDPCDDFYEYACGDWYKKNPLPPNYNLWSADDLILLRETLRIQAFLKEPISKQDDNDLIRAKELYNACMNMPNLPLTTALNVGRYVKVAGYFPLLVYPAMPAKENKSWQHVHNYFLKLTGRSALFTLSVYADRRHNDVPLLYLREVTSPYGLLGMSEMTSIQQARYIKFLIALLKYVAPLEMGEIPVAVLEKRLAEVIEFRIQLQKIKSIESALIYSRVTVNHLNDWYNNMAKKNDRIAQINWIDTIQSFRGPKYTRKEIEYDEINIENKNYFRLLVAQLANTKDEVIANHANLYFIERNTRLYNPLKKLLLDVVIQNGKLKGSIRYLEPRWFSCVSMTDMNESLRKRYVFTYFPKATKQKALQMIEEFKAMMKLQIEDSTWLTDRRKLLAKKKIDDMKSVVGYPDYYDEPSKRWKRKSISMKPHKPQAFYSAWNNVVGISAAYFTPPLYHPGLPYTVAYGTIGDYIAHEMYHAFGPRVVKIDQLKEAWSSTMSNVYTDKLVCFVDQFDGASVKELADIWPKPKVDGYRTLDENVVDTMGLKLGYWTLRKKMWETKKCEILPNIPNVTCEQLYFISFASTYCSVTTVDRILAELEHGVHSPTPRLRVNGALANVEGFKKAFGCSKKKAKSESKSCDLWR